MADETKNDREDNRADPAWQKLTPAADTTMNANTDDDKASPASTGARAPQNATGTPERPDGGLSPMREPSGGPVGGLAGRGGPGNDAPVRSGDVAIANDLPHGMSEALSDAAIGGTMAQGTAAPGAADPARRNRGQNPDTTDTATADEGQQQTRTP